MKVWYPLARVREWFQSKLIKALYSKWTKSREGPEWAFVHPWDRRFINNKLAQGLENWTLEDAKVLGELMTELGKRIIALNKQ